VPEEDVETTWKVQASRNALKNPCNNPDMLKKAWEAVKRVRGLEFVMEHSKALAESNRLVVPGETPLIEYDQFTDAFVQHCMKNNIAPDPPNSILYLDHSGQPVKIKVPGKGERTLNYSEYAALSGSIWKGVVFEMTVRPNIGDGCYYNPVSVHMITPRSFGYKLEKAESPPSSDTPFDDVYNFMHCFTQGRRVGEVDNVKEAMIDNDCDYTATNTSTANNEATQELQDDAAESGQDTDDPEESPSKRRRVDDSD